MISNELLQGLERLSKKAVKLKKEKGPSSQKFPEKISGAFARAFSYLEIDTGVIHAKLQQR
jgi:hypothetical protein